jgi:hypothetical protein
VTLPPPTGADDLTLLRIVCAVAWADGQFSEEERTLLQRLMHRYGGDGLPARGDAAGLSLSRLEENPGALDELVKDLDCEEDRELALKLSYMMIRCGRSGPEDSGINRPEKATYRRLVELLGLPEARIEQIEWAAEEEMAPTHRLLDVLAARFLHLLGEEA